MLSHPLTLCFCFPFLNWCLFVLGFFFLSQVHFVHRLNLWLFLCMMTLQLTVIGFSLNCFKVVEVLGSTPKRARSSDKEELCKCLNRSYLCDLKARTGLCEPIREQLSSTSWKSVYILLFTLHIAWFVLVNIYTEMLWSDLFCGVCVQFFRCGRFQVLNPITFSTTCSPTGEFLICCCRLS